MHSVRLGNTDPLMIKVFRDFLLTICGIESTKIRYGLQIFSDVDENEALHFWQEYLSIERSSIMPTISRIQSGKIGTYKIKMYLVSVLLWSTIKSLETG